jgi:hypothetical protein
VPAADIGDRGVVWALASWPGLTPVRGGT